MVKKFPLWSLGFLIISVPFNRAYSAFADVASWEYRVCFSLASCVAWLALLALIEIKARRLFSFVATILLFAGFILQMVVISFADALASLSISVDLTVIVSAVCAGAGFAIYYCLWAAVFERMHPALALLGIAASIGLSATLSTLPILLLASSPSGTVICFCLRMAMLTISLICLHKFEQQVPKTGDTIAAASPHKREVFGYVWRASSAIAVAWFVIGVSEPNDAFGSPAGLSAVVLAAAILAAIIVILTWTRGKQPGYLNAIYSVSSAFGIVLLLVSVNAGSNVSDDFWMLQFISSPLFNIILLGTLVSAHSVFKMQVHRLVCIVLSMKELSYLAGNLLEWRIPRGYGNSVGVVMILAYLLLLFVISAFTSYRSSIDRAIPQKLSMTIGAKYRLTPREVDVLRCLLQGSSYVRIGKQLFIASSTVKTHVNHIYSKMGVANRDQFIDLTNSGGQANQEISRAPH
ncbi:MAG: helix-turn-helix transcriptional regulator [Coriobacteriia bacterium]|nr:helix-turn-helix transcriptional regulator [Coriobacteriia bacterium]